MDAEIRRKALRATARLVLPATMLGCAAAVGTTAANDVASGDPAPAPPGTDATAPPPAVDAAPADVARIEPGSCAASDASRPLAERAACCGPIVADAMARDAGAVGETLACCSTLAQFADQQSESGTQPTWVASPQRGYCCRALGWTGSIACAPWGPPVPPAFVSTVA
jgi:hypothetical protein